MGAPRPLPSFLSCLGNTLENLDVRPTINDIAPLQHCIKLKSLQISLSTNEIPSFIGDLTELTWLKLSHRSDGTSSLPASISNLKKMKRLTLHIEHIATPMPDIFKKMKSLTYLELSLVQGIKKLPRSFGNMTALKELRLSKCEELEELPVTFGKLKRLRMLCITECPALHEFPDSFGDLESLKCRLYWKIEKHQLKKTLVKIKLHRCEQIKTLPKSIFLLRNIQTLTIDECFRFSTSGVHHLLRKFRRALTFDNRIGMARGIKISNGKLISNINYDTDDYENFLDSLCGDFAEDEFEKESDHDEIFISDSDDDKYGNDYDYDEDDEDS